MPVKPEKSSSLVGVYFFASLMTLVGASLGFVYMLSFPAQAFSSQREYEASLTELAETEEPVPAAMPGDAYYIEGPVLSTGGWQAKRTQLQASGAQTVRLSAGEINAWMTARFRPGTAPEGSEKASMLITPGVPNVGITEDGAIWLNLPTDVTTFGEKRDLTVFARAVPSGDDLRFEIVHVSSAKVPLPNLLGRRLLETLSLGFQSTEDYKIVSEAFARAESIVIENDQLVLELR